MLGGSGLTAEPARSTCPRRHYGFSEFNVSPAAAASERCRSAAGADAIMKCQLCNALMQSGSAKIARTTGGVILDAVTGDLFPSPSHLYFITDEDGRLHASNLQAIRSGEIGSDLTDHKINLFDQDMIRIGEDRDMIPSFMFGPKNASAVCQKVLQQDHTLWFGYDTHSSSELGLTQSEGRTTPPRYPSG